ncbi:MAG: hypothetical protein DMD90_16080 [Candidatus Rokuibacteriota bacterium]|nr:MAG: hypothetical protein DMD90_16080 [Candidatus Rokubacteria bacterium]
MKHADGRARPEPGVHLPADALEVQRHLGVGVAVLAGGGERIGAVIAHVEGDHVEALGERSPERNVPVDREAVAVGDEHPRAVTPPMPANADDRPTPHDEVERLHGNRELETHGTSAETRALGRIEPGSSTGGSILCTTVAGQVVMTIASICLEKNLSSVLRTLYEEICPVRR